jgi:hypothetical protein
MRGGKQKWSVGSSIVLAEKSPQSDYLARLKES